LKLKELIQSGFDEQNQMNKYSPSKKDDANKKRNEKKSDQKP